MIIQEKTVEFKNPLKNTSIEEIKQFIFYNYKVSFNNQILYLSNKNNKNSNEKINLKEGKLIKDYIDSDKKENNLFIHLKEKKIIKLILLNKKIDFECWANEKVEILQDLFFEFIKLDGFFINKNQIWITNNNEEIEKDRKLEEYSFQSIIVKFKIEAMIFYEGNSYSIKNLDWNTEISEIKSILCRGHNLTIPESSQDVLFKERSLKNNEKIYNFLDLTIENVCF